MEVVSLRCPNCGAMLTVPDTYVGRSSQCGRCKALVAIPRPTHFHADDARRLRQESDWRNWIFYAAFFALLFVTVSLLLMFMV